MVSAYDADERLHRPAPAFLSRPPTRAERRRLRRLLAALPQAPRLVFWPESIAIDGPWSDRRKGAHPRPDDRRHRPDAPDADGRHRKGPAADRPHRADGPDSDRRDRADGPWSERRHRADGRRHRDGGRRHRADGWPDLGRIRPGVNPRPG